MIVLDRMLVGGIKFVLGKVAAAVEAELYDETPLREELLEAQMRLELGEIEEREFARIERRVLDGLKEIRRRQREAAGAGERAALSTADLRGAAIEAHLGYEDGDEDER